jgi:two-component system sensor histidine kinase and response regulator WspE
MKARRPKEDQSHRSMLELFRVEVENQAAVITGGLLELERAPRAAAPLEALMRAAHSLKGAAQIVNLETGVGVAHALEDCFVAAQQDRIQLRQAGIDACFRGVDLLLQISKSPEIDSIIWEREHAAELKSVLAELAAVTGAEATSAPVPPGLTSLTHDQPQADVSVPAVGSQASATPGAIMTLPAQGEMPERVIRLTAATVDRLLGLAGESLVESRWLNPFADSLLRLKRLQAELAQSADELRDSLSDRNVPEQVENQLAEVSAKIAGCRQFLAERLVDLESHGRRSANLSHRLYREVLQSRMRPFGDGIRRFPRMVRDLARALGKEVRLEVNGEQNQVDRDILEKLEAPLAHLLRNAVDHGCETAAERRRTGKPAEGVIRLEARHSSGTLLISVSDDGAGIDPGRLREAIVAKRLIPRDTADKLSERELLDFLLLPGFTMRDTVTEFSGRGVGLDVVQNMVRSVRGSIRITTQPGRGMRFQLQLPLTLSVIRALLVEVAGEPYAIPLTQITRTLKLPQAEVQPLEGRQFFTLGDQQIGLLTAHQVLDRGEPWPLAGDLPVVILSDRSARYGLVVDRFLGERELVVQTLDPRLGKIQDISAGALMEDGSPVLIVDVEDLVRSIGKLIASGTLARVPRAVTATTARRGKRILAVDDSLTVRELEQKLLASRGYVADVAVDGMDGWNAVRMGGYDLVITDVDMPRMDGIELTTLIKASPGLKSLPVMIVSYKDREEDRLRGLEAGADYYLAKGSFHDETLLQAVTDLIGEADA